MERLDMGPFTEMKFMELVRTVDDAAAETGYLFERVRAKNEIPLAELRHNLIPVIQEVAANHPPLFALVAALQAKEDYTRRHHLAVGILSHVLGQYLGLENKELRQLTTAALLHDVGKMLIPEQLLHKTDKLTPEERDWMQRHTVLGFNMLRETIGVTHRQALVALQHHERMDGSGYPFGLTKERIDLFSRIVAVADMFHAMISNRVYRAPSPFYEVLFQMQQAAFGALDPVIVRLFLSKMMNSLIGQTVMLTDGREGTVLMVHAHDPTRPLIQVEERFIDLSQDLSVQIQQIF
jgi:putative nucleotidyltransferase with HDIG domain